MHKLLTDNFKKKILYMLSFILYMSIACSQGSKSDISRIELKKNVIYATFGIYVGEFYGTFLGNYERMILVLPRSFVQSLWFRVGAGPWVWWSNSGWNYTSTLSALTGRKNAHLEIGSGVLFSYNSYTKSFEPLAGESHLAGYLGFRYQKPGGSFLFRTGIGWPEFMYLSLGFCF
jgi:hypothetical protein